MSANCPHGLRPRKCPKCEEIENDNEMLRLTIALAQIAHTHKGYPNASPEGVVARNALRAHLLWQGHAEKNIDDVMMDMWCQTQPQEPPQ